MSGRAAALGSGVLFLLGVAALGFALGGFLGGRVFGSGMGIDRMLDALGGAALGTLAGLLAGAFTVARLGIGRRALAGLLALAGAALFLLALRSDPGPASEPAAPATPTRPVQPP